MQIGHQGKKILKQMFWALTPLRAIKEMGGFHDSILQEKMWTINQKLRKILHENCNYFVIREKTWLLQLNSC